MTLDEFDALTKGDTIRGPDGAVGTVIDVQPSGVRVTWGGPVSFFLARFGTIWFQMDVVKPSEVSVGLDKAISEELANPPKPLL